MIFRNYYHLHLILPAFVYTPPRNEVNNKAIVSFVNVKATKWNNGFSCSRRNSI
jgi:hypothetical protein